MSETDSLCCQFPAWLLRGVATASSLPLMEIGWLTTWPLSQPQCQLVTPPESRGPTPATTTMRARVVARRVQLFDGSTPEHIPHLPPLLIVFCLFLFLSLPCNSHNPCHYCWVWPPSLNMKRDPYTWWESHPTSLWQIRKNITNKINIYLS